MYLLFLIIHTLHIIVYFAPRVFKKIIMIVHMDIYVHLPVVCLLGGITLDNALSYLQVYFHSLITYTLFVLLIVFVFALKAGATHIIITSYVFCDGTIAFDRLTQLCELVTKLVQSVHYYNINHMYCMYVCMYVCML